MITCQRCWSSQRLARLRRGYPRAASCEPSAVLRTALVTSVPTFVVMAPVAPSFAPITAWWMKLRRSASSSAMEWPSMAGTMVAQLVLAAVVVAALCLDSSRTVLVVTTVVDLIFVMALEAKQMSMPLPGSPGLYVLQRIQRTPTMKVVAFSCLYWPPVVVRSVSLAMLARSCSRVIVRAAKQVSAMIGLFKN